jgi:hypothetical protein
VFRPIFLKSYFPSAVRSLFSSIILIPNPLKGADHTERRTVAVVLVFLEHLYDVGKSCHHHTILKLPFNDSRALGRKCLTFDDGAGFHVPGVGRRFPELSLEFEERLLEARGLRRRADPGDPLRVPETVPDREDRAAAVVLEDGGAPADDLTVDDERLVHVVQLIKVAVVREREEDELALYGGKEVEVEALEIDDENAII